jgi:protein-tyrosine phosphatase
LFFSLLVAGYVPILTHPERLTWIEAHYETVQRLAQAGVWMQLTAGSVVGAFGRRPRYWSERMLDEGLVHILATDAHDVVRRPPNLGSGRDAVARRIGNVEAEHLVTTRPQGVLQNLDPSSLPGSQPKVAEVSEKLGEASPKGRSFVGRVRNAFGLA